MFGLFDSKAAVYGTPFFMPNQAMAMRGFGDMVNDNRSMVAKHPEDFTLYMLGEFDDNTGVVKAFEPPSNLGSATQFVKEKAPQLKFGESVS